MSNGMDENGQTTQNVVETKKISRKQKLKILLNIGLLMFFDLILPFILYFILVNYMKEVLALLISGIPPLAVSVYGLIKKKQIDVTGTIIIISFIISAVASLLKDDPKLQLLRKTVVSTAIGVGFLISSIPIKIGNFKMRPFAYYLCKDLVTGGVFGNVSPAGSTEGESIEERLERYWSYSFFRRGLSIVTAIWGCGLVFEAPIAVLIIYKMSTDQALIKTTILGYVFLAIMLMFSIICFVWMKKKSKKILADTKVDASNRI